MTLDSRAPFALCLATLLSLGGCALDTSDIDSTDEELMRSLDPAPSFGTFAQGDSDPDNPFEHCDLGLSDCLDMCPSLPPLRRVPDDPYFGRQCETQCYMEYWNCIDDVTGDGGPVDI